MSPTSVHPPPYAQRPVVGLVEVLRKCAQAAAETTTLSISVTLPAPRHLDPVLDRQDAEPGSRDAFCLDQLDLRADVPDELHVTVIDDDVNRGIDHRVVDERLVSVDGGRNRDPQAV